MSTRRLFILLLGDHNTHILICSIVSVVQPKHFCDPSTSLHSTFHLTQYWLICYSILFDLSLKDQITCTANYTMSILNLDSFKQVLRNN